MSRLTISVSPHCVETRVLVSDLAPGPRRMVLAV